MAKRPVPLYDFAAFGQAIKAARTARKESRKDVSDAMNISPRYLIVMRIPITLIMMSMNHVDTVSKVTD